MTALVRAQSLRGYRELVKDLGGNPTRLLRKAGIEPSVLDQLAAFISFASLIDLLERSASELDRSDFGLCLADRQDIGVLGTLAVAMRYSTTVGDALRVASKYLYVYNATVAFTIITEKRSSQVVLAFDVLEDHADQRAQTVDHGLGLAWRIVAMLSERRSRLHQVWFPHPPAAPESAYRSRFHAPLTFEAERAALAIGSADLDLAVSDHNDELRDLAVSYLRSRMPAGNAPFEAQVRHAIEKHLGTGACSYRSVAAALHVHPRTLQRRLREEGTTFEAIKDEIRRDLARRYLSHREVPLSQVSILLDYSEPSALGRSVRRWFNTTPRELRARL